MKSVEWIVKQPGQHGKKLRVVERIGLDVCNDEILAGVCEILTSRTSTDNYSDATEQKRAKLIAAAPELLVACQAVQDRLYSIAWRSDTAEDADLLTKLQSAITKATGGDK